MDIKILAAVVALAAAAWLAAAVRRAGRRIDQLTAAANDTTRKEQR